MSDTHLILPSGEFRLVLQRGATRAQARAMAQAAANAGNVPVVYRFNEQWFTTEPAKPAVVLRIEKGA